MRTAKKQGAFSWGAVQLWPLLLALLLHSGGALEPDDTWELGSGLMAEEVNVLKSLVLHSADLVNVSLASEHSCPSLELGQYSTLSVPSRTAFGDSFADELSVLTTFRSPMSEETGVFTILNLHGEVSFQIRINPNALIFISSRRGHYEFPVPFLTDGKWHRVGLAISAKGVSLHVDCKLVETLPWSNYFGLGVSTDGIVMLGGLIEPYDVPFKGSLQQLLFVMGDSGAAGRFCKDYNQTCLSGFPAEQYLNLSRSERGTRLHPQSKSFPSNTSWKGAEDGTGRTQKAAKPDSHRYISELDLLELKEEDLIPTLRRDPVTGDHSVSKTSKKEERLEKPDPLEENVTVDKQEKSPVSPEGIPTDKSTAIIIDLTKDPIYTKATPLAVPDTDVPSPYPTTDPTISTARENKTGFTTQHPSYSITSTLGGSGTTEGLQIKKYPTTQKPKKPVRGFPGPRGPPGCPGRPGFRGPKGDKGDAGVMGRTGMPGNPGPRGPPGLPTIMIWGNSAEDWAAFYQTSFYQLLYAGWPRSRGLTGLPGISGRPGSPGLIGPPGWPGEKGQRGLQGPPGLIGPHGIPGIPGRDGSLGLDGKPGSIGLPGTKGVQGFQGDRGPGGEKGEEGFQGPPGPGGEKGIQGTKGSKGEPGLPGAVGLQGPMGAKGLPGLHGPPGTNGEMGIPGVSGPPGPEGEQGLPGLPGTQGVNGSQGDPGPRGASGPRGPQGPPGIEGLCGPPGHRGPQGMMGPEGPPGQKGDMGEPGVSGLRGERGPEGPMGLIGWPGPDGLRGDKGRRAADGEKGDPGVKGNKGIPGPVGVKGPPGDPGQIGFVGFQGPKGQTGPSGAVVSVGHLH